MTDLVIESESLYILRGGGVYMTDRRDLENQILPDFDEISAHILPSQNNLPIIAIGKNADGIDEPDELSYIEGQRRINQENRENPQK